MEGVVCNHKQSDMELACQFFKTFAGFESKLKFSGYIVGEDGKGAKPDWNSFARDRETFSILDSAPDNIKKSYDFIMNEPPKKQIVVDREDEEGGGICKRLKWQDVRVSGDGAIWVYIRRIRNNLFHGGKFGEEVFFDPDRSRRLLTAADEILNHMSRTHAKVI